jgi:hypothetical protein
MRQHAATCGNMRQHAATCGNMRQHATSDLFIEVNRQRQNDPARARVVGLPGGGMRLEDPPVAHLRSAYTGACCIAAR